MQVIIDVKSMMCLPNCEVMFQGFYMRCQPVAFIITLNYWPFLPYMTENHTEKLICLLFLAMIHTA